jgi:uncharacterized protein DUF4397
MMKSYLPAALVLLVTICASSCSVNNNDNTSPQQGSLLVANVSPDATPVNILINSNDFTDQIGYGTYTPYYLVPAGSYTISVTNTGSSALLTNTVTLDVNKSYSYILIDSFKNLTAAFMQDNFRLPGSDSIYIRFFNFSPNSQPLTLHDSAHLTDIYSLRTFNDQAYQPDFTNFMEMPAGNYTFQLRLANDSILATKKYELDGGHVVTIFAKGFVGGTDTQALGIGQIQNY